MEERLDDAIYVLRNHAEGQFPREFHGSMGAPVGMPGYPAGSVPSSLSVNTSTSADSAVRHQLMIFFNSTLLIFKNTIPASFNYISFIIFSQIMQRIAEVMHFPQVEIREYPNQVHNNLKEI